MNYFAVDSAPGAAAGAFGYTWLPFAVVGTAFLVLALVARFRNRGRESTPLIEFLLIRGFALLLIGTLVGVLADAAAEGDGVTGIDRPIWSWFIERRSGAMTSVMNTISDLGSTVTMGLLAAAVSGLLLLRPAHRSQGILVAIVAAGAGLLVVITKPLVGRARPPVEYRLVTETNQSFPSGHSLASAAIIGVIAVVLVPMIARRGVRGVAIVGAAIFVALIGVSRLYLAVHWSTDVFGGWLIGIGWMLFCVTMLQLWRSYPAVRQMLPPGVQSRLRRKGSLLP